MKVYKATYLKDDSSKAEKTVPVAAQSLQHAARKASKEEGSYGELVKIEATKDILI